MNFTELPTTRGTFGVRQLGDHGPQVICLHGFPDDASTYDTLAAHLAGAGHRVTAFASAVLFAGAHPAYVQRNARRSPRQLWASRYIIFFQFGAFADRRVARDDFAYIDTLWRRWAPGFTPPDAHLAHVKRTLAASMPAPIAMYRASGFSVSPHPIAVPTLYLTGEDDRCALPPLADGQEALFTTGYRAEIRPGTGHFPHLEQPDRAARSALDWITQHT